MVQLSKLVASRFVHHACDKLDRDVEKRFMALQDEGKQSEDIMLCLRFVKQTMHETILDQNTKMDRQIRQESLDWLSSDDGIKHAVFLGIRKSAWLESVGILTNNVN